MSDHTILTRIRRWLETRFDIDGNATPKGETHYMAMHRACAFSRDGWHVRSWIPRPGDRYSLTPTWFKTLTNAAKRALGTDDTGNPKKLAKPPGVIFVLDIEELPAICPTDVYKGADKDAYQFADHMMSAWARRAQDAAPGDEREYADRQVHLWSKRVQKLRSEHELASRNRTLT